MVTYVATLDVPRHVVEYLSRQLAAHRRRIGTPRGSRALGPFRQAVLVLRWFRERGCVHCLSRDARVSQATGYRYLHEGIDILADRAPDLHQVLDRCRAEGMTHVVLDGTLIESDRVAGVGENGNDIWFSQKHKAFGGDVQFLAAPDGTPLWVSAAEPGSTPDITAARMHALPALYKAAADGLPTLADKGYTGAGIGILVPVRRPKGPIRTGPTRRHTNHEHPDHRDPSPRRTRRRRTQATLAHPPARHPQPEQDRRHRPRRPRPQRNLEMIGAEKTSLS